MEITQLYSEYSFASKQLYLTMLLTKTCLSCQGTKTYLSGQDRYNMSRNVDVTQSWILSPHPWLRQSLINNCNGLYKEVGGLYSSWSLRANYLQASSMHGTQDMIVTTTLPFSPPSVKVGGHRRNSKLSPLKRNGWVPTHLCSGLFYFPFLITKRDLYLVSWEEHTTSFRLMAFTRQF